MLSEPGKEKLYVSNMKYKISPTLKDDGTIKTWWARLRRSYGLRIKTIELKEVNGLNVEFVYCHILQMEVEIFVGELVFSLKYK
jgi:hypothetical protein